MRTPEVIFIEPSAERTIQMEDLAAVVDDLSRVTGRHCDGAEICDTFPDAAYEGQDDKLREVSCIALQAMGCDGCPFDRSNEEIGATLRGQEIEDVYIDPDLVDSVEGER